MTAVISLWAINSNHIGVKNWIGISIFLNSFQFYYGEDGEDVFGMNNCALNCDKSEFAL